VQLELFKPAPPLSPWWREQLKGWLEDAWRYRHNRHTTGWSMATQGMLYARLLYKTGQMEKAEFRRWFKFHRRILRWDSWE